jgi:large subunit ribosomal protein L32e
MKGLADKWRKPRGVDNKQRMHLDYAGAIVDIGWRQPRAIRYMHPSGAYEILVHNAKEIEAIKHTTHVVRIAATVGAKKRATLRKLAAQKKLRVLN